MSNIEKLQEELSQSPELQKKIDAEAKRIAEHNEAAGVQEAMVNAKKARKRIPQGVLGRFIAASVY